MHRWLIGAALATAALAAPAGAQTVAEHFDTIAAHAQGYQLWIHERYPHPAIPKPQLDEAPRPDVSVRCGKKGCASQLARLRPLFVDADEMPGCRGFTAYVALRLLDGRGAPISLIYIDNATPSVVEIDNKCYAAKKELDFDGGDVFGGLFKWVK